MAIDGDVVERIVHEKEVSYQSQDLSDEEPERELRGVHDPDRPRIRMPDGQYIFADDLPLFHIRQMLFSPFRGLFFHNATGQLVEAGAQSMFNDQLFGYARDWDEARFDRYLPPGPEAQALLSQPRLRPLVLSSIRSRLRPEVALAIGIYLTGAHEPDPCVDCARQAADGEPWFAGCVTATCQPGADRSDVNTVWVQKGACANCVARGQAEHCSLRVSHARRGHGETNSQYTIRSDTLRAEFGPSLQSAVMLEQHIAADQLHPVIPRVTAPDLVAGGEASFTVPMQESASFSIGQDATGTWVASWTQFDSGLIMVIGDDFRPTSYYSLAEAQGRVALAAYTLIRTVEDGGTLDDLAGARLVEGREQGVHSAHAFYRDAAAGEERRQARARRANGTSRRRGPQYHRIREGSEALDSDDDVSLRSGETSDWEPASHSDMSDGEPADADEASDGHAIDSDDMSDGETASSVDVGGTDAPGAGEMVDVEASVSDEMSEGDLEGLQGMIDIEADGSDEMDDGEPVSSDDMSDTAPAYFPRMADIEEGGSGDMSDPERAASDEMSEAEAASSDDMGDEEPYLEKMIDIEAQGPGDMSDGESEESRGAGDREPASPGSMSVDLSPPQAKETSHGGRHVDLSHPKGEDGGADRHGVGTRDRASPSQHRAAGVASEGQATRECNTNRCGGTAVTNTAPSPPRTPPRQVIDMATSPAPRSVIMTGGQLFLDFTSPVPPADSPDAESIIFSTSPQWRTPRR